MLVVPKVHCQKSLLIMYYCIFVSSTELCPETEISLVPGVLTILMRYYLK